MGQPTTGELEWILEIYKPKKKKSKPIGILITDGPIEFYPFTKKNKKLKECKHSSKYYAAIPDLEGIYLIKCSECNKLIHVYLPKS